MLQWNYLVESTELEWAFCSKNKKLGGVEIRINVKAKKSRDK